MQSRSLRIAAAVLLSGVALLPLASTEAQESGSMQAISLDMDISGNTATSLNTRDECVEALPGDTITIDVTATEIPAISPMIGYSYQLFFDGPPLAITAQEPLMILASPGSHLLNVSDPPPVFDSPFSANVVDTGEAESVEIGSGVLDRLTIEISTDAAPGVYAVVFGSPAHIDPDNEVFSPLTINDARIAIGISCESSTPLPSRTANPPPPTQTPIPTTRSVSPSGDSPTPTAAAPTTSATVTVSPPTVIPTIQPASPALRSTGDSTTTLITVVAALSAGLAAAALAGWLAYRSLAR